MNHYTSITEFGVSNTHFWYLHASPKRGFWRVGTSAKFCRDGFAVMDDFGNLVQVMP